MSETKKILTGNQLTVTHTVGPRYTGVRIDRFLMDRYRHRSREKLKKAIDSGAVTVFRTGLHHTHKGRMKPSFALHQGDIVQLISIRRPEPEVNFDYHIIYEDDFILVVNKPANLPVHPAGRYFFHTLLTHLKTHGFSSHQPERDFFLVHRIDKETSGILLLAKTSAACNALTSQFRARETEKTYLALVHGAPSEKNFEVHQGIGKHKGSPVGLKMYVVPEEKGGLSALTTFQCLETRSGAGKKLSLMACSPHTGRQHQIRVHAEFAGIPLVGDKLYGISDEEGRLLLEFSRDELEEGSEEEEIVEDTQFEDLVLAEDEDEDEKAAAASALFQEQVQAVLQKLILPRHALHAHRLKFRHPQSNIEMELFAELPADLRDFFDALST